MRRKNAQNHRRNRHSQIRAKYVQIRSTLVHHAMGAGAYQVGDSKAIRPDTRDMVQTPPRVDGWLLSRPSRAPLATARPSGGRLPRVLLLGSLPRALLLDSLPRVLLLGSLSRVLLSFSLKLRRRVPSCSNARQKRFLFSFSFFDVPP